MIKVTVILSLYHCKKYLKTYFENVLTQENLNEIELSIVHNSPSLDEKLIIEDYKSKINIKYQEVDRECLYKSWNRAIKQSTGKYLVCWNVDDLREKDSISTIKFIFSAPYNFFNSFILKRGYRDGITGFNLSILWASYGFLKHLNNFKRYF